MNRAATKKGRAGSSPRPAPMHEASHANTPGEMSPMTPSNMTSETIACGKINSGQPWVPVALDVLVAITLAGLTKPQNYLVFQCIINGRGEANRLLKKKGDGRWPDPLPSEIKPTAIAESQDRFTRPQLSKAKRELIESKLFKEDEDGMVVFNEQFDEWVHHRTGEPRLGPGDLLACRRLQPDPPPAAQQGRFDQAEIRANPRMPHMAVAMPKPVDVASPSRRLDVDRPADWTSTVPQMAPGRVTGWTAAVSRDGRPSPAPIEERGRVLDSGELNRVGESQTAHPDSVLGGRKAPDGPTHGAVDEVRRFMAGFPKPSPERPAGPGASVRPPESPGLDASPPGSTEPPAPIGPIGRLRAQYPHLFAKPGDADRGRPGDIDPLRSPPAGAWRSTAGPAGGGA